jgi:tetratricopeptide (TPR) repeat protein
MSPDGLTPTAVEAHKLVDAGRYGDALALLSAALALNPGDAELTFARASVLFDWGRIREAYTGFLQAERLGLTRISLYLNMAWSCQLLQMSTEAERHARSALAVDPANAPTHFGLGTVLQRMKRYEESIASYERALELEPDHVQAMAGIARCRLELKDFGDAEAWLRRAVVLAPESPVFRINLGGAMANQGRHIEALEILNEAALLEAAQGVLVPRSMIDIGFSLVSTGQYDEALELFRNGLPRLPDPRAHGYYAFLLLTLGYLREGWSQYEFRWMQEPHLSKRPDYSQPSWSGQDLSDKTIVVLSEQGAGDIIHFSRFALPLKKMGAKVVLQTRPELMQVARRFAGVEQVLEFPAVPAAFDYYIPLMSIPHVLGIELPNIPANVPYLEVDPAKASHWAARISSSGLKVGIAWAGNPKYPRDNFRSIAFEKLSSLWGTPGIQFYSLQTPLKEGELAQFPPRAVLVDLAPDLRDFADTAAVIAQLDLVICVDTAIAHLAGALGKPVWLMLPEIGDFRWLEEREDSPWYPTMRLFRQRKLGEWADVIERVRTELLAAVEAGAVPPPKRLAGGTKVEEPAVPTNIARVAETRYGILQYLPEAAHSPDSLAYYGEHLQPQLDLLSKFISPGAHIIEAGCGIGAHTVALARMVRAEGHVLAYEARRIIQQILRENVEANQVAGIVTLMRGRLGNVFEPSAPGSELADAVDTVDSLLLDRLELLKLNEVHNAVAIIEGASDTLWRLRPIVWVAAESGAAAASLARSMGEFGYRGWRMETRRFNTRNFNRRDDDVFNGESAWALLAIPEERDVAIPMDDCVELAVGSGLPFAGTVT